MKTPPFETLPRPARQAAVSILGWRNRFQRYGAEYREFSKFLEATKSWPDEEIAAWQRSQLGRLVESARKGVRHYAAVLPPADRIEEAPCLAAALEVIPILTKTELRGRPNEFRNLNVREVEVTSTSGSTGSPMQVGHDALSRQRRFAFLANHLAMAGVDFWSPSVRLSGRILCPVGQREKKPWLFNRAENQLLLSSYHLDESHAPEITSMLQAYQPLLLDGYPSGILQTLRLVARRGERLPSLRAIVTTAETLYPEIRDELRELSGVPVMDYYAASEGVSIIQQCPEGTYHIRWQSGIFEVDTGQHLGFEGDGELICTSFIQERTPLIRYRTGDFVKGLRLPPAVHCACGLRTATVSSIEGRVEDLVRTPDGRSLGMFTYRTLKLLEGIREAQVIQNDYAQFEVHAVIDPGVDHESLAARIRQSFERALGYPITLRLQVINQIPRGANGKVRLVLSKVHASKRSDN